MSQQLILPTPEATDELGRQIAAAVLAAHPDTACIYLHGELGAGKTSLARGFLRGCGHTGRVPSPTYTLVEPYDCDPCRVFHMDLYRLQDPGELEYLGISELLEPGNILLIEWPERAAKNLVNADLEVFLEVISEGRAVILEARSPTGEQVVRALDNANA